MRKSENTLQRVELRKRVNWVLDADIRGFFDAMSQWRAAAEIHPPSGCRSVETAAVHYAAVKSGISVSSPADRRSK
jgi:hypothetical protein